MLTHLQIPLKEPFRISGGEVAVKDAILVTVETSSGMGLGESSPMAAGFGYSSDTPEGCWDDLPTRSLPACSVTFDSHVEDIAALASTWKGSRFAAAGAENALWDLLGQAHHATIAELLGASTSRSPWESSRAWRSDSIPRSSSSSRRSRPIWPRGIAGVKIKIQPGRDVELVRAVRQHFGDIPLMVDANGAYTVADLDVFRELDDFDLLMFEQPMAAADLDGLAALQSAVTTPVCLDETAETLEQTAAAIRRGPAGSSTSRSSASGGLGPALAIHDLCQQNGIACWVGSMPELGIGQAPASIWPPWPTASTPATSSPAPAGSSTTTWSPRSSCRHRDSSRSRPSRAGVPGRPAKVRRYQVDSRNRPTRGIDRMLTHGDRRRHRRR